MGLIGANNPAGCIKCVSGGAEESDSSDKQGGSAHLSHLLSFLCFCLSSSVLLLNVACC